MTIKKNKKKKQNKLECVDFTTNALLSNLKIYYFVCLQTRQIIGQVLPIAKPTNQHLL